MNRVRKRLLAVLDSGRLQTLVSLLLLSLLLWQGGLALYYGFWAESQGSRSLSENSVPGDKRWRWFARANDSAQQTQAQPLQVTKIQARLLGVLQHSQGNLAIIDTGMPQPSQVYREGDQLLEGVLVARIDVNQVALNERGQLRLLVLEAQRQATAASVVTDAGIPGELIGTRAQSVRSKASTKPGLEVAALPDLLVSGAGLQPDDLILAIAGQPVADLLEQPGDMQALLSGGQIEIELERLGQRRAIQVEPAVLAAGLSVLAQQE